MNKKVINLGKVKGRTLDLKVEDKIIKKKYDDETEWQDVAELTGGVDVVDNADELPSDASENDIVFVENEVFSETVEYQEEMPIVLTGGEQRLNVEFKQDTKFIHETNVGEICSEVNDKENAIVYDCLAYTPNSEINVSCVCYPPSLASVVLGVEQSIDAYMVVQYNDDDSVSHYYKFRGLSAKDFITNIVEFPGTEEQIEVLLGEHYTDKSEDNPSYNWVKLIMSEESLNDNSVFLEEDGAYFTLEYDTTVDIKGLLLFDGYVFEVMKMLEDGETESLFSIGGSISYPDDNDGEYDFNEILKYGNAIANIFLSGGMKDVSYDVYKQKGFHIYENGKWASLEEKMNIARIVDAYSDLPKSFTENGLMVVSNEEKSLSEPTSEINAGAQGLVAIKPTFSVAEEMDRIKQLAIENGAPEDLDWENGDGGFEVGFYDPNSDYGFYSYSGYVFENDVKGIVVYRTIDYEKDIEEVWCYADESGAELMPLYNQDTNSYETFTTSEGGCWYYYVYQQIDKEEILITPPTKYEGTEPFFMSDKPYMCEGFWVAYYSDDFEFDAEPSSFTLGFIDFYDFSKIQIYPKGFYKYTDNRWYYQPEIGGTDFDNEDVLRAITEEDIGNIELNTEARHEHNNKYYLDQIDWNMIDNLNENTNARHTHNNKSYLDQIGGQTLSDINSNTKERHTHSNLSALNRINDAMVNSMNNINSGNFSINSISANSISTELPNDTSVTPLFSEIIDHSGYMLPFNLTWNQAYLVVFDGIRYKFMYTSSKIGDESKYGFEIVQSAGYTTVYTADNGIHDLSISIINSSMINLASYIYDRTNNIDAISVNTDTISAKSISMELLDEANTTLLFSGTSTHSGYMFDGNILTLNQVYLVVFDDIKYKIVCAQNEYGLYLGDYQVCLGGSSKYGFVIVRGNDGVNTIYTSDNKEHNFSISIIEPSMMNLADYINALELKISHLESKLQS